MNLLSYVNPVNWVKRIVYSSACEAIDANVTADGAKKAVRQTVNWCVGLSESKIDDERLRKVANGMISLGKVCGDFGHAIHPDGDEGRKVSEAEMLTLLSNFDFSIDALFADGGDKLVAANVKAKLRAALDLED